MSDAAKVEATTPPAAQPPSPAHSGPKLEGDALLEALRVQLDFYFSKQNLSTDSYLLAQMNQHPNKSVPLDIICGFRKVKALTDDKQQVVQAMKLCKNLSLDESAGLVKANVNTQRSTLILRDMPADTNEAELRAVFEARPNSVSAGHIVSLLPDINDCWRVTFDSEAAAMDACLDIQTNVFTDNAYTYRGKPIHARMKNETLTRSFYNGPPPPTPGAPMMMQGPPGAAPMFMPPGVNPYQQPFFFPHGYVGYHGAPMQTMPYMGKGKKGPPAGVDAAAQQQTQQPQQQQPQQPQQGKKAAKQAAQQAQQGQQAQQKAAPAVTSPTSPAAAGTTPTADGAAAGGKKKKKKGAAADAAAGVVVAPMSASGVPLIAPSSLLAQTAAAVVNANDPAAQPLVAAGAVAAPLTSPTEEKAHLTALYGHAPRIYSREQLASVVEKFISAALSNSSLLKRPDSFEKLGESDLKAVCREKPATSFSILDPFPVIYPASPSPLLAAQPHHSSSLPFLELGGGALDAPYFSAESGFAAPQSMAAAAATQGRRKSQSGPAGKKPPQAAAAPAGQKSARGAGASPQTKARQIPAAGASQPTASGTPSPPAPAAAGKPQSFAAAALASANNPQQPAPKPAPKPAAARPTSAAPKDKAAEPAKDAVKKDAPKKKKAAAAGSSPAPATASPAAGSSPAPTPAAAPAKPAVPNYASRVGAISPAEAAAKAAAQRQAKEAAAKEAEKAKAAANPAPAAATPAADAKSPSPTPAAKEAAAPAAASSSPAAVKTPESPSKPAFSYAAMIKKAPATPAAPAAARPAAATTNATAPAAAAPRDATVAASPAPAAAAAPKSDAGNWRRNE